MDPAQPHDPGRDRPRGRPAGRVAPEAEAVRDRRGLRAREGADLALVDLAPGAGAAAVLASVRRHGGETEQWRSAELPDPPGPDHPDRSHRRQRSQRRPR